ncbi:MAG: signal peptidase I [Clostridia bacterium]|nr:signal peptidase I [Clostridia bacterium]
MWNIIIRIGIEIAAALIIALLLRRFVCALALVKGRSMLDTLQDRELMFALRYGLFGAPKRFDVVICRYPKRKGLFVKRIIGLPGETISMEEDIVYINGEAIEEDFPRRKCLRKIEERALGDDEYFVMGDNRPSSTDSRRVGPLKREQILYRAGYVVLPLKNRRKIR